MNRTQFIGKYTDFIKTAMKLAKKAMNSGIPSLEDECEDIDDELFKQGLRFIVDKMDISLVDEILSNWISHEKDKYTRLLMTMQKRAVLGIQAGISLRAFYYVLSSLAGLSKEEERKVESMELE